MDLLRQYGDDSDGEKPQSGAAAPAAQRKRPRPATLSSGAAVRPYRRRRQKSSSDEHPPPPADQHVRIGGLGDLLQPLPVSAATTRFHSAMATRAVLAPREQFSREAYSCVRWAQRALGSRLLAAPTMRGRLDLFDVTAQVCAPAGHGGAKKHVTPVASLPLFGDCARDAAWLRPEGGRVDASRLVVCGGSESCVVDVAAERESRRVAHGVDMTACASHPSEPSLFVTGLARGGMLAWDTRAPGPVRSFTSEVGCTHSVAFLSGGTEVASACAVLGRSTYDRSVMLWDFASGSVSAPPPYPEGYSCSCVRVHPKEGWLAVQSDADYIAVFKGTHPYKLNRKRRFEGHSTAGNRIGCGFSADGALLATGSTGGDVHLYDAHTAAHLASHSVHHRETCSDAAFCPLRPDLLAATCWDGSITLLAPPTRTGRVR